MKPDLRFLIFLNVSLLCIALLAIFKFIALPSPKPDFGENIERLKQSASVEAVVENAGMFAKSAMRRGEQIKNERRVAAFLGGFVGFVSIANLFFMIVLYRQIRSGVYFHDGVELEKT